MHTEIIKMNRGEIVLKVGERSISVFGEGYSIGPSTPYFVLYANSIDGWKPPFDHETISEEYKKELVKVAAQCLIARGIRCEID